MLFGQEMSILSKNLVSELVSELSKEVSVSVSVSNFGSAWYQYQYQYRNFRPAEYQYRIGIEFVDQESISIVSVSEKVVSKGSGPGHILTGQTKSFHL